jgi:2-oxoglutarate ferredoxin oxidoreductase subunit alpha
MYDLTVRAFEWGEHYRNPVMILADGIVGQMAEAVELTPPKPADEVPKPWALTGCRGRLPNVIRTLYLEQHGTLEKVNRDLDRKYRQIAGELQLFEEQYAGDAELMVVAYGISARIARAAVKKARADGVRAGLLRLISLWPFPSAALRKRAASCRKWLVLEMSNGQMVEDVRLAFGETDRRPEIFFMGCGGGWCPRPDEVDQKIRECLKREGGQS